MKKQEEGFEFNRIFKILLLYCKDTKRYTETLCFSFKTYFWFKIFLYNFYFMTADILRHYCSHAPKCALDAGYMESIQTINNSIRIITIYFISCRLFVWLYEQNEFFVVKLLNDVKCSNALVFIYVPYMC